MKIIIPIPKGDNTVVAISGLVALLDTAKSFGADIDYLLAADHKLKKAKVDQFSIAIDEELSNIKTADLVIVPPLYNEQAAAIARNTGLIHWLKRMKENNPTIQIASLCTGVYFLAATGLLNGKEASSHLNCITELTRLFPEVNWKPEKVITDHAGFYTSGGTFSSFNLIVYLFEKFFGNTLAITVAKIFSIDYNRKSQAPFHIFSNQKKHEDQQVLAVQQYIESHFKEPLLLDDLAREHLMSKRSLLRRFKKVTGSTPKKYIQKVRIENAKRILETTHENVSTCMSLVGYNDLNTFRKTFVEMTGYLPGAYRRLFMHHT